MFKASAARLSWAPRLSKGVVLGLKPSIEAYQERLARMQSLVTGHLANQSQLNDGHRVHEALDNGYNVVRQAKRFAERVKWKLQAEDAEVPSRATPETEPASGSAVPPKRRADSCEQDAAMFASHKAFIENLVGYKFQNDHWLKQALTLDSARAGHQEGDVSQTRMALIGDANLRQVYYTHNCHYRGKKSFCGAFSILGSNNSLAYVAHIWGLGELGRDLGYPTLTSRESATTYGTLVEAIIGAVFMDSSQNYNHTERAVMRLLSYTEQSRDAGTSLDPDAIGGRPIPARPDKLNKRSRSLLKKMNEDGRRTAVAKSTSMEAMVDKAMAGQ